ncbi:hypothetical protein PRIPAC_87273, partial [Pristionchus pacificus]|uniref:Uncharacterized protein n=1 Tax=Pristionchus pacificus TaxID=54126 RepID=A0A2A6CWA8_PRIPA
DEGPPAWREADCFEQSACKQRAGSLYGSQAGEMLDPSMDRPRRPRPQHHWCCTVDVYQEKKRKHGAQMKEGRTANRRQKRGNLSTVSDPRVLLLVR